MFWGVGQCQNSNEGGLAGQFRLKRLRRAIHIQWPMSRNGKATGILREDETSVLTEM